MSGEQTSLSVVEHERGTRLVTYLFKLGDTAIGGGDLSLVREDAQIEVNHIQIRESERGKGYGKEAYRQLMSLSIKENDWLERLHANVSSLAAFRMVVSAPVPEGWFRYFTFVRPDDVTSELITYHTSDPDMASQWLEAGQGALNISVVRKSQSR